MSIADIWETKFKSYVLLCFRKGSVGAPKFSYCFGIKSLKNLQKQKV